MDARRGVRRRGVGRGLRQREGHVDDFPARKASRRADGGQRWRYFAVFVNDRRVPVRVLALERKYIVETAHFGSPCSSRFFLSARSPRKTINFFVVIDANPKAKAVSATAFGFQPGAYKLATIAP